MVRFGKIISVDPRGQYAVIRENTPKAIEFLVMSSELAGIKVNKFADVSFVRDTDFSSNVAMLVKVHRLAGA